MIDNELTKTELGILVSQKSSNLWHQRPKILLSGHQEMSKQMGYLDLHKKMKFVRKGGHDLPLEKRPWERRLERGLKVASFGWEERERVVVRDGFLGMQGRVKQWIAVVIIIFFGLCRGKCWDHKLNHMELAFTPGL